MYAKYQTVAYTQRVALGNKTNSQYAASVMADWVGMLTGAITNVSQLSDYADKTECFIQGAAGDWVVFDNDAHATIAGKTKVLRRLCTDGVTYQYMYIGFDLPYEDNLNGVIGFMGGWDSVAKKPTTVMTLSCGHDSLGGSNSRVVPANTILNTTNVPINQGSPYENTGTTSRGVWNTHQNGYQPISYGILSTPALMTFWANPLANMAEFPMGILAEYNSLDDYNTPASGITPIVYSCSGQRDQYPGPWAPFIKNTVGSITQPASVGLRSLLGHGGWNSVSNGLSVYGRDANGAKTIPVVPVDVVLSVSAGDIYTYAGRLKELFATMATLQTSDTFKIGADTYVVIPSGGYNSVATAHSASGKLCAKVQ